MQTVYRARMQSLYTEAVYRGLIQALYTEPVYRASIQRPYTNFVYRACIQSLYTEPAYGLCVQSPYTGSVYRACIKPLCNSPTRTWILYGNVREFGDAGGSLGKRCLFFLTVSYPGIRLPGDRVNWRVKHLVFRGVRCALYCP
jgi:hypothetical protein